MKRIYIISLFIVSIFAFTSCAKDETENISDVTNYATFEMQGSKYLYWQTGESYVEPGVNATENGTEIDVTITGNVDTDTPGVYTISYSATNSDGYPASTVRYVAVGDKAVASSRDLSGNYIPENEVSKIDIGFYQLQTVYGGGINIPAFMVDMGDGSLIVPPQGSSYGVLVADPSVNPDTNGVLNSEDSFTLTIEVGPSGIIPSTFEK